MHAVDGGNECCVRRDDVQDAYFSAFVQVRVWSGRIASTRFVFGVDETAETVCNTFEIVE